MIRLLGFVLLVFVWGCKSAPEDLEVLEGDELGVVDFEVSGGVEAQPHFLKGLLLLHSFEYEDAAEEFRMAYALDSTMVMAYWGEAMTYNHPLWARIDLEKARGVLNKFGATKEERLAKAEVPLERDFLESVEVLFGDGEKVERDDWYSEFMAKMYDKYPGHHEVAAFYALSLIGSAEVRDEVVYEKGAKVVKKIIEENPLHPGALHYLIHAYDDPDHAEGALFAADAYAKVAPAASHALHMPTHIYFAMGDWDKVISSNIESFDASANRKERKNLDNTALSYHAFHWLMYGYVQIGDESKALDVMNRMHEYSDGLTTSSAKSYRILMEANYRTDRKDWDPASISLTTDVSDLNIEMKAVDSYTKAMIAYAQNDMDVVQALRDSLAKELALSQNKVLMGGSKMCSAAGGYAQLLTEVEVNHAQIIEYQLRALLALKKGKDDEAEKLMAQAIALEEETSFAYGPPVVPKPSAEMYADWLLSKGRKKEAATYYERVLERNPGRRLAVLGLEAAAG